METNNYLLWAQNTAQELDNLSYKMSKQSSKNQLKLDDDDTSRKSKYLNLSPQDHILNEKKQEKYIGIMMKLTSCHDIDTHLQLSYLEMKKETPNGFQLIKTFDSQSKVIDLRTFLDLNQDYFSPQNPLNLIEFAHNLTSGLKNMYRVHITHNDIRMDNICYNKEEKVFKLVICDKSTECSPSDPNASNQDKLGLLLLLLETAGVASFDNFNLTDLPQYLDKLGKTTLPEFADILSKVVSSQNIPSEEMEKLYVSLKQHRDEVMPNSTDLPLKDEAKAKYEEEKVSSTKVKDERVVSHYGDEESKKLIPTLTRIQTLNQTGQQVPPQILATYSEDFFAMVSKKVSQFGEIKNPKIEIEEEPYYASGCVLNHHFRSVKNAKSNNELQELIHQANNIIDTFGPSLEPHPLYKLHKVVPNQEALENSQKIKSSLQTENNPAKPIVDIITQMTQDFGIEVVLTKQQGLKEFDSLHVLATGDLTNEFLKVTLTDLDENDFEKMAQDPNYAAKIYKKFRQAVQDSNLFKIENLSEIKIVAVECNSPPTAVIPTQGLILNPADQFVQNNNVIMTNIPIIKFLTINLNQFYPQANIKWPSTMSEFEKRGGLDYYFPRGWQGYGLNVIGKYQPDDKWLKDWNAGWAVAYHGVGSSRAANPGTTISSILNSRLKSGRGQACASQADVNPLRPGLANRTVGTGVYFGRKISISENSYSQVVTLPCGKKFKVLLQCRLNPTEIRIPQSQPDYYIVPEGHSRPYRILVKEIP